MVAESFRRWRLVAAVVEVVCGGRGRVLVVTKKSPKSVCQSKLGSALFACSRAEGCPGGANAVGDVCDRVAVDFSCQLDRVWAICRGVKEEFAAGDVDARHGQGMEDSPNRRVK